MKALLNILIALLALSCATTVIKVYDENGKLAGKFSRSHLLIKQNFKVDTDTSGALHIDVSTESGPGEKATESAIQALENLALQAMAK